MNYLAKVHSLRLDASVTSSIIYHNLFDYPLKVSELSKWSAGPKSFIYRKEIFVKTKNFLHIKGKSNIVAKRMLLEKISKKKMKMARLAAKQISLIPTIKFVGVTGSLAMMNAGEESDIDLMIITTEKTLWTTRLITFLLLLMTGFKLRRSGNKNEKDKLCLNMWFDETDLVIKKRNIFTAHEIVQIVPLVNKNKTYEKFLWENKWVLEYWPNAVGIRNYESGIRKDRSIIHYSLFIIHFLEQLAFKIQYQYMKSKITREEITPTRAFFHPFDWGKYIINSLK